MMGCTSCRIAPTPSGTIRALFHCAKRARMLRRTCLEKISMMRLQDWFLRDRACITACVR